MIFLCKSRLRFLEMFPVMNRKCDPFIHIAGTSRSCGCNMGMFLTLVVFSIGNNSIMRKVHNCLLFTRSIFNLIFLLVKKDFFHFQFLSGFRQSQFNWLGFLSLKLKLRYVNESIQRLGCRSIED